MPSKTAHKTNALSLNSSPAILVVSNTLSDVLHNPHSTYTFLLMMLKQHAKWTQGAHISTSLGKK